MINIYKPKALAVGLTLLTSRSTAQVDPKDHQEFADELISQLYTNPNECTSALGVSMALSLLYPGSTGDGVKEMKKTLGFPKDNMLLAWEATTQDMLDKSGGQCLGGVWDGVCNSDAPTLKIANSVWFDDNSTLHADYEAVVGDYAMQIDFESVDSPSIVNEWVKESTNGLIDEIVEEGKALFPPYVLLAINSIYLKARWHEQFQESLTKLDIFYDSAARRTQVSEAHFMNNIEYFMYSHDAIEGYQIIDLKFLASDMSMILVLPIDDTDGENEAVESSDLIDILEDLTMTRVALSLPKFKFESEYEESLKTALINTGIEASFEEGAGGLCGLFQDSTNCEQIFLQKIIQKTVIDVNEKGVEAAAVTGAMAGVTSAGPPPSDPVQMVLDHPFQFFIYDKSQGLMLFEGRLGEPKVPEAEPAVSLLEALNPIVDKEFWLEKFSVNITYPPGALIDTMATTTTMTSTEGTTTIATTTTNGDMDSSVTVTSSTATSTVTTTTSTTTGMMDTSTSSTTPSEETKTSSTSTVNEEGTSTTSSTSTSTLNEEDISTTSSTTAMIDTSLDETSTSSTLAEIEATDTTTSTTKPTEVPDASTEAPPPSSAQMLHSQGLSLVTLMFLVSALGICESISF